MRFTRKAVSLFSGCGGFCEGIETAGFKVVCAVELDRFAADTYRHNFSRTTLFEGDIAEFVQPGTSHIEDYKLNDVDLVFGGPPCQGFSQIGPRDINDERNHLYEEFSRVVATLRPKIFLMENVPNLLLLHKGIFRDRIISSLQKIGYANTTFIRVKASDFGVPQDRNRVVFLGSRDDLNFPAGLQALALSALEGLRVSRPVTVHEAIGDLPLEVVPSGHVLPYPKPPGELSAFQREMRLDRDGALYLRTAKRSRGLKKSRRGLHNHHTKEILERRKRLIGFLAPGAKADSLPKSIWNGTRPEKWRRLHPNAPSYTILAQMHRDLSEWVHPSEPRWITVREAARLQSFHDGFVFVGSEWQQLKQIGNAVPPLLAFALGKVAATILNRAKRAARKQMPDLRAVAAR